MKRVLVTGASGLVGWSIARALSGRFSVTGVYRTHRVEGPGWVARASDLLVDEERRALFDVVRPEVVIHVAALADVPRCEKERDLAQALNVEVAARIAAECSNWGAHLIHVSTDMVFDGEGAPYGEEARPKPSSFYGRTKELSEAGVSRAAPGSTILRCALVYGGSLAGDRTFNEKVVRAAREGGRFRVFVDEFRTPIDTWTLGRVVRDLIPIRPRGIVHAAGSERLSRHEFAVKVLRSCGLGLDCLEPVERSAYSEGPPRPFDLSLRIDRLEQLLGWRPGGVDEGLHLWLAR